MNMAVVNLPFAPEIDKKMQPSTGKTDKLPSDKEFLTFLMDGNKSLCSTKDGQLLASEQTCSDTTDNSCITKPELSYVSLTLPEVMLACLNQEPVVSEQIKAASLTQHTDLLADNSQLLISKVPDKKNSEVLIKNPTVKSAISKQNILIEQLTTNILPYQGILATMQQHYTGGENENTIDLPTTRTADVGMSILPNLSADIFNPTDAFKVISQSENILQDNLPVLEAVNINPLVELMGISLLNDELKINTQGHKPQLSEIAVSTVAQRSSQALPDNILSPETFSINKLSELLGVTPTNTKPDILMPVHEAKISDFVRQDYNLWQSTQQNKIIETTKTLAITDDDVSINAMTLGLHVNNFDATTSDIAPKSYISTAENITTQIVESAKLINTQKNSELTIHLKPEHLGEVSIRITVEKGQIAAVFNARNDEVKNIIEASLPQLKQDLSNSGLKVDHVSVFAGLGEFFQQNQRQNFSQAQFRWPSRKNITDVEIDNFLVSEASASNSASSAIDYRI